MKKAKQFGETVEGFSIPVLNEREIRASAGILFLILFWSWIVIIFKDNYLLLKYVNMIFLLDFMIRLFISPRYAPSLIIGRLFVRNQTPEYVGAAQKKFAWTIGLVLASVMFLLLIVLNTDSVFNFLFCHICLIFLFFESVFGICLGCKFYPLFFKEQTKYCPGDVCVVKTKDEIQKTSRLQIWVVVVFLVVVIAAAILFHDMLSAKPTDLWVLLGSLFSF